MAKTLNDLSKKYSLATRITHWLTVLGIFALIPLGLKMHEMDVSAEKLALYKTHNIIGFIILFLTLYRIYLYFKHDRPPHLKTGSKWNDKLVVWNHSAVYIVILLMTFSGLSMNASTELFDVFKSGDVSQFPAFSDVKPALAHYYLYLILAILILMHIVGFLKHWILKKENTFKRMF